MSNYYKLCLHCGSVLLISFCKEFKTEQDTLFEQQRNNKRAFNDIFLLTELAVTFFVKKIIGIIGHL